MSEEDQQNMLSVCNQSPCKIFKELGQSDQCKNVGVKKLPCTLGQGWGQPSVFTVWPNGPSCLILQL